MPLLRSAPVIPLLSDLKVYQNRYLIIPLQYADEEGGYGAYLFDIYDREGWELDIARSIGTSSNRLSTLDTVHLVATACLYTAELELASDSSPEQIARNEELALSAEWN